MEAVLYAVVSGVYAVMAVAHGLAKEETAPARPAAHETRVDGPPDDLDGIV